MHLLVHQIDKDNESSLEKSRSLDQERIQELLSRFLEGKPLPKRSSKSDDDESDEISDEDLESAREPSEEVATFQMIDEAARLSTCEPISLVYKSEYRAQMLREVTELVISATLDSRQLEAFLFALMSPVHCIQGPPGTGKSYIGVVLVQAFQLVQYFWRRVCPSVGTPPVLVLSYKNHAVDEFLLDLLKSEGKYWDRKSMVRLGGGCKEEKLVPYLERTQLRLMGTLTELESQLEILTHFRQACLDARQQAYEEIEIVNDFVLQSRTGAEGEENKTGRWFGSKSRHEELLNFVLKMAALLHGSECYKNEVAKTSEEPSSPLPFDLCKSEIFSAKGGTKPEKCLPKLFGPIAYLGNSIGAVQLLWDWISGASPPRQCAAKEGEDECFFSAVEGGEYCDLHVCLFGGCFQIKQEV